MADGRLTFDTKLDNGGLVRGLKEIGSVATSAVKGVAKIGSAAVLAGAASAGALTKSAVDSYAAYEQLVGGIETLFGAGGQTLKEYAKSVGKSTKETKKDYEQLMQAQEIALKNADNAYKTAGLSANDYMETVTGLAASLKQSTANETEAAKAADQAIIDMSDNANKIGTSMESIQNAYAGFSKQNYTMLDNLKLGYGGTKTEMQRLLADAEKLKKAQGENVSYSIDSFADVVSAIHVVQDEIGITGTTAKEASTTIEGSVNSMKAAWENLLVGIADDNADFDTLVNNFVETVKIAASNILPRVEIALAGIGSLIEKLLPVVVEAIPGLIEHLLPKLLSSGTSIVLTLIQGITSAIPSLLSILSEVVTVIGTSLVKAAPQLFSSVSKVLSTLLGFLMKQLPNFCNGISEVFSGDGVSGIINMVFTLFDSLATSLINALPIILNALINMMAQILIFIINQIPSIVSTIVGMIPAIADGLLSAIPILVAAIPSIISGLIDSILACIPDIINAGIELLGSLTDNLPEIINSIVTAIPEIITGIIDAFTEHFPDIVDAGYDLITSLVDDLPAIIITIVKAIPKITTGILNALVKAIPKIVEMGVKVLGSLVKNIPEIIGKIVSAIPEIITAIIKAFDGYAREMSEIGKNLIEGLWNGIKDMAGWIGEKIKGFGKGVMDSLKDFFGIHSPSRKFKWIGQMCVEGFEEPMEEYNPYETLNVSMKANKNTLKMNYAAGLKMDSMTWDYDRMGSAMVYALEKAGFTVNIGKREFGRIVREVM